MSANKYKNKKKNNPSGTNTNTAASEKTKEMQAADDVKEVKVSAETAAETAAPEVKESAANAAETAAPEVSASSANAAETAAPEVSASSANAAETAAPEVKESSATVAETAAPEVKESSATVAETAAPEVSASSANAAETAAPEAKESSANAAETAAAKKDERAAAPKENFIKKGVRELDANMKALLDKETERVKKLEKKRGAEIMGVFAKHNFYVNGLTPAELRTTLEDLGPTYVKIGQIMSSRVDLLPESYCKELEKLRQNVQELDPKLARAVIEQEAGNSIDELFSEFRDKPLGSASVGQAHYGVLKDGRRVVVKVQRPMIAEMMRNDFVLLRKMAAAFNVVAEGSENSDEQLDLVEVIKEFEKVTEEELDFRIEAQNTKFFKENVIEDETKITCPDVVEELTTERMFTMSFVDGYSISKKDRLIADGYDLEEIGRNIVNNYAHQVLDVGVFHADPHQGNIMVAHGVPTWIDFGMIGRITESDIGIIQSMVLGVLEKDVESIANALMSMGAATAKTNRDRLIADLDVFMDRYCSVTSINDMDMAVLFTEITELGARHHVKMPGKFTMLVRSLTTIEGVIEQLCPELNLFEIISGKLMDRAKKSFDLQKEIVGVGKDALEIAKKAAKIPALASDVLKGVARGRMKVNLELTGYEELLNKGSDSIKNVVLAIFACVIFFGGCLLCMADLEPKAPGGMPVVAAAFLILAVALGIHALKNIAKKK